MRSLHGELTAVQDFRRGQGRKRTMDRVLTAHVLSAELANIKGCLAAAQFARLLSEVQLTAGSERAAMHDRLEISGIRGTLITFDALHTVRHRGTD